MNKFGGYAYIPGTGPKDKKCRDCAHFWEKGVKYRCQKWKQLAGKGCAISACPPINKYEAACKYFDEPEAPAQRMSGRGLEVR